MTARACVVLAAWWWCTTDRTGACANRAGGVAAGTGVELLYAVEKYQTVVLVGETGCGKSTRESSCSSGGLRLLDASHTSVARWLARGGAHVAHVEMPQYLDEAGWTVGGRVVGCTQPRQVAAATVAARVADEMGVRLGMEVRWVVGCSDRTCGVLLPSAARTTQVGYSVRFDNCTHQTRTRVKFLTDGVLIRETMLDPLLSRYHRAARLRAQVPPTSLLARCTDDVQVLSADDRRSA